MVEPNKDWIPLEELCALGVDCLLTLGAEETAFQGSDAIAELVKRAAGGVAVMVGSGIKQENACRLIEHTGVQEIRVGLWTTLPSPLQQGNPAVTKGDCRRPRVSAPPGAGRRGPQTA